MLRVEETTTSEGESGDVFKCHEGCMTCILKLQIYLVALEVYNSQLCIKCFSYS